MSPSGESHREAVLKAQKLAVQYFQAGNLRDALVEARKAAELDHENTGLQNLAGAIALETKDIATAVNFLRHSLSLNPQQAEPQFLLGNALMSLQSYDEAIDAFTHALALDGTNANAAVNLGLCLDKKRDHGKAERSFHRALNAQPNHPEANNAMANLLIRKGQHEKAENYARNALESDPSSIVYVLNLAKTLRLQKKFKNAEDTYRLALKTHPYDPSLLTEIGGVLRDQHLFDQAEAHYEEALKLAPRSATVLQSAGVFFQSIRSHEKAKNAIQRYLELNPDDVGMLNNLAISLRDLDLFDEAENAYLECAKREKEPAYVYNNLGILAMEMAKPEDSIEYYRKALEHSPTYAGARSNMLFYMNYIDSMTPKELYEEHRQWQTWHVDPNMAGTVYHDNNPDPDRPLRIGYLSADLYGHAVSYFIEPALQHHNSDKFEIFCYAHVKTPDKISERLQSYADQWRYVHQLNDQETANLIKADKIDILVELGGHTAGNRLQVMGLRPAPIQVTWIGYPNTTGLDAIDYRFVDDITDPEGLADEVHSEKLWRLPRSFTCYNSQTSIPAFEELPCENDEKDRITFGSFNNASKISMHSVETWARILKRVENSRLILKSSSLVDQGTQDRFHERFKKFGIPAERVEMYGRIQSTEHLRFYDKIDIGLDTFPYNGTTTSCEALFMNVPVIALLGDRHAARVTASLISQIGLTDLVAETSDEYVDIAVDLANDRERLRKTRDKLRERMLASPLCDHAGHTREVEDAYRDMWRKWCSETDARASARKAAGYPEDAPYRPIARVIHGLGGPSFIQFSKCIAVLPDVALLTDMHALGMNIFSPLDLAQTWFKLFEPEEWEVLKRRSPTLDFIHIAGRIHDRLAEQGKTMVMTDWCHLDYVGQPFLPVPSYELHTVKRLKEQFDVREVFVTRHPLAQWHSYCRETNVSEHVSAEEFFRDYLHFAKDAVAGFHVRLEDFAEDPDACLKKVCAHLDISFDESYRDEWSFYRNVTGDAITQTIEQRGTEEIEAPLPTNLDADLMAAAESTQEYADILDILGYD